MDSAPGIVFGIVVLAILFGVSYGIASLTTKNLLKDKSEGIRRAGFALAFGVAFVLVFFTLVVGSAMVFHR